MLGELERVGCLDGAEAVWSMWPGDRLAADGVAIIEEWDEPDYVSVKFRGPDGYVIEAASEPDLQ